MISCPSLETGKTAKLRLGACHIVGLGQAQQATSLLMDHSYSRLLVSRSLFWTHVAGCCVMTTERRLSYLFSAFSD
jgi:hypothetical protein